MTHLRALLLPTAAIALLFGISPPDPDLTGEPLPVPFDHTLLAAGQSPKSQQNQVTTAGQSEPFPGVRENCRERHNGAPCG
jgi:hypothetical protein